MLPEAGCLSVAALDAVRARSEPVRLVIFDCDGVLIDSEPLTDRVVSVALGELGWRISPAECHGLFLGMSFYDMVLLIETRTGQPLPPVWVDTLVTRLVTVLAAEVEMIDGAGDALAATEVLGLPWRVASNSSPVEMAAKFGRVGLAGAVDGRLHSVVDLLPSGGRGKPAPDIFLAAAAAEGVPPDACIVVEDSVPGVRAARAAGMQCLGFSPSGDGAHLVAEGAAPFHAMRDLPALFRAAVKRMA
jgi:beta-phosphoglucomutase-like phosphatase (HAD superfamily)